MPKKEKEVVAYSSAYSYIESLRKIINFISMLAANTTKFTIQNIIK